MWCFIVRLGFGRCQRLRAANETLNLLCDPLYVNTRRCSSKFGMVHTKCRIFETCDQAVVVSGGWNREASLPRLLDNAENVYYMLRTNGFRKGNIKVFFANGLGHGLKGWLVFLLSLFLFISHVSGLEYNHFIWIHLSMHHYLFPIFCWPILLSLFSSSLFIPPFLTCS